MKSWAETNVFTSDEVALYHMAVEIVERLPEPAPGARPWRCHEVARHVGTELELPVVDGQYGTVEHSWLSIPARLASRARYVLLDVYAVGALPLVRLVDVEPCLPHELLYREGPPRSDVREEVLVAFRGPDAFLEVEMKLAGYERLPSRPSTWVCRGTALRVRSHTVRRWIQPSWPDLETCRRKLRAELDAAGRATV